MFQWSLDIILSSFIYSTIYYIVYYVLKTDAFSRKPRSRRGATFDWSHLLVKDGPLDAGVSISILCIYTYICIYLRITACHKVT